MYFFFQAEDGIRDYKVTGVQTCALPIAEAATVLRRRRFRVDVHADSVAAEKGDLGETGNLIFHLALLALLFALAVGAGFGDKGNVLVTEGEEIGRASCRERV